MENVVGSGSTIGVRLEVSRSTWKGEEQDWAYRRTQLSHHFIGMAHGDCLRGDGEKVDWSAAIWTSRSIPRQSFHAWLVVQNRIPTRDRMIGWGIQVPPLCLLCNVNDESRDHLYWDCNYTFDLWSIVAGRCRITPERRWENTLHQMITLPPPTSTRSLILLGWPATLYWIWNERNVRPRRSSEMMQLWFR